MLCVRFFNFIQGNPFRSFGGRKYNKNLHKKSVLCKFLSIIRFNVNKYRGRRLVLSL